MIKLKMFMIVQGLLRLIYFGLSRNTKHVNRIWRYIRLLTPIELTHATVNGVNIRLNAKTFGTQKQGEIERSV